jgi:hypothetical protein
MSPSNSTSAGRRPTSGSVGIEPKARPASSIDQADRIGRLDGSRTPRKPRSSKLDLESDTVPIASVLCSVDRHRPSIGFSSVEASTAFAMPTE